MACTIVERGRCLHTVVNGSVWESGSDLLLMRSTIAIGGGKVRGSVEGGWSVALGERTRQGTNRLVCLDKRTS